MQSLLTSLLLPPLLLVLLGTLGGWLAWRGRRGAGLLVLGAGLLHLLLATPYAAGLLLHSLEAEAPPGRPVPGAAAPPAAIIVLGGDAAMTADGLAPGPLTLERLRAGAALHRRTGLPLLVTAGPLSAAERPLGETMARSLDEDFRVPARWVEPRARDTRENAVFSAALLRQAGIGSAWLVTHGWHMPRAQAAFARAGFATHAAPVHPEPPRATGRASDWVPRPDHLAESWFALREWAGRVVYAIRD